MEQIGLAGVASLKNAAYLSDGLSIVPWDGAPRTGEYTEPCFLLISISSR
jgi:hypothetical protein